MSSEEELQAVLDRLQAGIQALLREERMSRFANLPTEAAYADALGVHPKNLAAWLGGSRPIGWTDFGRLMIALGQKGDPLTFDEMARRCEAARMRALRGRTP